MKARTISKTIDAKVKDWLKSLPLEVSEQIASKVVVTGGSIASMFLKEPVNDYDMYFRDIKAAIIVAQHYCKKWIEENDKQRASGNVVKEIVPCLRLTSSEDVSV